MTFGRALSAALVGVALVAVVAAAQAPPDRAQLIAYCKQPASTKLGACSLLLRGGCQFQGGETKPYCGTLSILNALCAYDNPASAQGAGGVCAQYVSYCAQNAATCSVDGNLAWPGWTNSSNLQFQVKRMCDFHNMVRWPFLFYFALRQCRSQA